LYCIVDNIGELEGSYKYISTREICFKALLQILRKSKVDFLLKPEEPHFINFSFLYSSFYTAMVLRFVIFILIFRKKDSYRRINSTYFVNIRFALTRKSTADVDQLHLIAPDRLGYDN